MLNFSKWFIFDCTLSYAFCYILTFYCNKQPFSRCDTY